MTGGFLAGQIARAYGGGGVIQDSFLLVVDS